MRRVLACIMCGNMLEEEDRDIGTCPRCRVSKEPPKEDASGDVFAPANLRKKKAAASAPMSEMLAPPAPAAAPVPARKPRILIIDDEPILLKFLGKRLESQGYDILTAFDGQEGFEKTLKEKPDLIISDVMMPRMTGYDLLHKLQKQTDGTEHIPILIMSAKGAMKEFFGDWEIHGFITKPIDPVELIAKIKDLLTTAEKVRLRKTGKKKT